MSEAPKDEKLSELEDWHLEARAYGADPESQWMWGFRCMLKEDNKKAMRWFTEAAAQGNPGGHYWLGMMYSHVLPLAERNPALAITHLEAAIDAGAVGAELAAAEKNLSRLDPNWKIRRQQKYLREHPVKIESPPFRPQTLAKYVFDRVAEPVGRLMSAAMVIAFFVGICMALSRGCAPIGEGDFDVPVGVGH